MVYKIKTKIESVANNLSENIYFIGVSIDSLHTISVGPQTPILLPCNLTEGITHTLINQWPLLYENLIIIITVRKENHRPEGRLETRSGAISFLRYQTQASVTSDHEFR